MKTKGLSIKQIAAAVEAVNKEQGYHLVFNRYPENISKNVIRFTVRSAKSGIPGARYSWTGRHLVAASWHAYGYVIEKLLEAGAQYVEANRRKIRTPEDNWRDWNVGSILNPVYYSDLSIL